MTSLWMKGNIVTMARLATNKEMTYPQVAVSIQKMHGEGAHLRSRSTWTPSPPEHSMRTLDQVAQQDLSRNVERQFLRRRDVELGSARSVVSGREMPHCCGVTCCEGVPS